MSAPCRIGLMCPHCAEDEEECEIVCIHPCTIETVKAVEEPIECPSIDEMTEMDCPLVRDGSDLDMLLHATELYGEEELASLMEMLRVAVNRRDRANVEDDRVREMIAADAFGRWRELVHDSRRLSS